jgi:hypothetical protein
VRNLILILISLAALAIPATATASATSQSASAGGYTATLSYPGGPGIETTSETLTITQGGTTLYDEPVPAKGCYKVCSPGVTKGAVQVLDLYGDGEYEVVLSLFTGGASCCGLDDVYVPSAAVGSYVITTHNFGQDGARVEKVAGKYVFLSGDNAFECEFTDCAGTALPLQVFDFVGDAFHNVTKSHPALIRKDATTWWKYFAKDQSDAIGILPAWAADEDNLGLQKTVSSRLDGLVKEGELTAKFVKTLQAFLKKHGYK